MKIAHKDLTNVLLIVGLGLLLQGCIGGGSQRIIFPKRWLFKTGDDPSWSDPELDDTDWAVIEVPCQWEEVGYPGFDGYAWYRLHFLLQEDLGAEPILVLGGVDDADETYLNGVKIGGLGGFPPDPHTEWNTLREYPIPKGLMKQGENVLAIRVYDMGLGGGLHKGPLGIFTRKDVEKMHEISSQPHHSFHQLPFTNGLCYSNYNCRIHRIDSFGEHIYRNYDKTTKTKNLLRDAHWVITLPDGRGIDLSKFEEVEADYLSGTGIVKVVKSSDNLKFTSYYFTPFSRGGKILVMLMKVEGRKKPYISRLTITPKLEFEGAELRSFHKTYLQKDALWSMAILTQESDSQRAKEEIKGFIGSRLPEEILEAEKRWWKDWHQMGRIPEELSEAERALYLQSTAVLKMGQCREPGRSYGQILASLPPAHYNIAWVRDGAYAIAGLARSGHLSEAKAGLEFMLQAKTGLFEKFAFKGKEYGIGRPYQISICRYYGGGEEETDSNQNGPNIELDGFGLFLWALEEYVTQSGDIDFLRKYWELISSKIADVLVHSIDETDLIRADSGPWERHLPGKHFSYTSAAAVRGLRAAAHFASIIGDKKREREYLAAEERLKKGIEAKLVDRPRGVIKGNLEDKEIDKYLDASAVEVINWVIDPQSPIAESTIKTFDEFLRMKKTKHGYFRILSGDWYDRQEWVMVDLRIASALKRMGRRKEAQKIINWVVAQSSLNYNLIAELYSEETTDYQGATPMCGFGAGAYILALTD